MSDVVLINPNINIVDKEKDHYSVLDHLGLGLVAASLERSGISVEIIDGYALNLSKEVLIEKALRAKPSFVGITCNFIGFEDAIDIARNIASVDNNPFIFMGGEHCTYSADEILANYHFVDAIVRGEGEITSVELINNFNILSNVAGIYYRDQKSGKVFKNPDRKAIDNLDDIPFARRDTLDYCKTHKETSIIGMLTQRGCNLDCHFCNAHTFFRLGGGKFIRRRSPQNIADEIEILHEKYYRFNMIEKMYFYDANFIDGSRQSKQWAQELAHEIIKRNIIIPFEVYMRGDSVSPEHDQELIDILKKAGLSSVFIGIESFDQNDLNVFGKKIETDNMERTINFLIENDIFGLTQGLIMFNPYSTFQGLRRTADFLLKYNLASFWNMSQKLQLFPGVKLISKLSSEGLLDNKINSNEVYSYKFQSQSIEKMSNYLIAMNDNPIVINDNAIMRYVRGAVPELYKSVSDFPDIIKLLHPINLLINKKIKEINELNHSYFVNIISSYESGVPQDKIDKYKSEYLSSSDKSVRDLDNLYNDMLRTVDKSLSEKIINNKVAETI
ncbi:MAG TPA: radical SAM protein [Syntrophales bacterium]|nr:MAG: B12 binding domain protein [Smithella sp. PtaU1.Bin162]HOI74007.1 radical SAM protein [Syntrophales bacterium]